MILASYQLLERDPHPTDDEIREGLAGNLCRCTGYQKIFDAVRQASRAMRAYVPEYDLVAPGQLERSARAWSRIRRRPIAGGTDLMVLFEAGKLPYRKLVSLRADSGIARNHRQRIARHLRRADHLHRNPAARNYSRVSFRCWCAPRAGPAPWPRRTAGRWPETSPMGHPRPIRLPRCLVYDAELELLSVARILAGSLTPSFTPDIRPT